MYEEAGSHEQAAGTSALAFMASEPFIRGVFDSIGASVAVLDDQGRILTTNRSWQQFGAELGADSKTCQEGMNYLSVCDAVDGEDAPVASAVAEGIRDIIAGRRASFELEYPCATPAETRWFICRISRFSFDGQNHLVVAHDDVTAAHGAQEEADAKARLFSALTEVSPVGVFSADPDGDYSATNRRWCEFAGISEEQALGRGWLQSVHPEDREDAERAWYASRTARGSFHRELRFLRPDGGIIWGLVQATGVCGSGGSLAHFLGAVTDITDRKQIELAMQSISSTLIGFEGALYVRAAAMDLASHLCMDMVLICRPDGDRQDHVETLAIVEDGNLRPNLSIPVEASPFEALRDENSGRIVVEEGRSGDLFLADRDLRREGVEAYAATSLSDPSSRVIGHIAVLSRTRFHNRSTVETILKMFSVAIAAAMQREASQQQYRDLFEFSPTALVMADEAGTITLVNRQAEQLFGWNDEDLVGQPIEVLVPPEHRDGHRRHRGAFLNSPDRRRMAANRTELKGYTKDGHPFPAEIDLAPVSSASGMMLAAAVRDVSDRKELETQAAQAMKMEAIAKLTGGLAHDFNNYLGVIMGNLDLLADTLKSDAESARLVDTALGGAERASELTQSLLAFSRRQPLAPKLTRLNQRVSQIVKLLRRTLGENIKIVTSLEQNLPLVRLDGAQFDSCLVNLAVNARDAMPRGGTIQIGVRALEIETRTSAVPAVLRPGRYVQVEMSDTGAGMAPDVLARVFEPFYTTKEVGQSTGLGLSMVYGFVQQSGGHIAIASQPGIGTTVHLYFPHVPENLSDLPAPAKGALRQKVRNGKRILVVEDNEELRRTVVMQLSWLGYEVAEAPDGDTAIGMLESDKASFDLVFTDIVMPGSVTGYDVAARACELNPATRVIITSGFNGEMIHRHPGSTLYDFPLLKKPYRSDQLAQTVSDALAGT